ncbi:hypothetical protein ROTO_35440 [Roseovarius tolerans]|uniref:Uncharacterized membrane protein n=1 Tax=Roseovarius tolerans TaxID=74031 RepID=A0A0L6CQ96_9RHOB|nr:DUF2177 family protein [Roseovarius tolerans]KNX39922.1 hypothetical protein ROTO_35440 [Roseovarius tolerans]SEN77365.1 Uncharacterized membrane protein [Roseovarius tolerans]
MSLLVLVLVTGVIFLIADAIMLSTVMKPLFAQHLGETLREGIRPLPAVLFYLIYMAGVVWFAGWPALRDGTPVTALVNGAILGLVAYGTYELTSWTVMRDWHPSMVVADMAWGATVTAVSAWGGVLAARAIS